MAASVGITLDPNGPEPLYKQIFDQIASRIRGRAFPPGWRLPPTRALAVELDTHRNTVIRAYEDLEAAGFVCSTVGRGTYVRELGQAPRALPAAAAGTMPWASLVARVAEAEPLRRATPSGGRDVVNLAKMQPSDDMLPVELLRRCFDHTLRTLGSRALGYAPVEGLMRLREAIVGELARRGVPASAGDVIVTTGSQQALDLVARALVNPGDTFLVDAATYPGELKLLALAGAQIVPVPSDGEGPDITALGRLARSGAKGFYVMPDCQNPTGATMSNERRRALVAWSSEAGVPLVEDDYGADLVLEGAPPPPPLRALDGDVLYAGTFSKKLAPALRIGFLVCPPALRSVVLGLKHAIDLGTSALAQHALAEFLERGYLHAHLNRILPEYRARRDALDGALRAAAPAALRWRKPTRGVVLWLPLPPGFAPDEVADEARRRGVLVSPSSLHAAGAHTQRGLRLVFCGEPVERLVEGGRRLAEALRAIARRAPAQREVLLEGV